MQTYPSFPYDWKMKMHCAELSVHRIEVGSHYELYPHKNVQRITEWESGILDRLRPQKSRRLFQCIMIQIGDQNFTKTSSIKRADKHETWIHISKTSLGMYCKANNFIKYFFYLLNCQYGSTKFWDSEIWTEKSMKIFMEYIEIEEISLFQGNLCTKC